VREREKVDRRRGVRNASIVLLSVINCPRPPVILLNLDPSVCGRHIIRWLTASTEVHRVTLAINQLAIIGYELPRVATTDHSSNTSPQRSLEHPIRFPLQTLLPLNNNKVNSKVILYYTNNKRTCLHTINKLPPRTAQVPARRTGITTGFSQARSCHTWH